MESILQKLIHVFVWPSQSLDPQNTNENPPFSDFISQMNDNPNPKI